MAFVTYPLNNIEYAAEDAELFHATRTSGIYAKNSFQYSASGANNIIIIGTGIGWIKNGEFSGKVIAQKEFESIDMGIADSVYPRIDAIVIQFNANSNETNIVVKKGAAASKPVAPSVVRNESVYELHLYHVSRKAGELTISSSNITDLRLNANYCGLMADSVTSIDTNAINLQVSKLIENLQKEIESVEDGSAFWLKNDIIPVSNGGTNATTREDAAYNLLAGGNYAGDFNENSRVGLYWCDLSKCAHTPYGDYISGRYGFLEVLRPSGLILQVLKNFASSGNTMYATWERSFVNNAWTEWIRTDANAVTVNSIGAASAINIGNYTGDLNDLTALPLNSVAWINPNNVTNSPSGNYAVLETWGSSNGVRVQHITNTARTTAIRMYYNLAWTEWEWVSPPMSEGIEYRTTERWNGNAVYTTLVNCGAISPGESTVDTGIACATILEYRGYTGNFVIPALYETTMMDEYQIVAKVVRTDGVIQIVFSVGSKRGTSSPTYIQVWYTK